MSSWFSFPSFKRKINVVNNTSVEESKSVDQRLNEKHEIDWEVQLPLSSEVKTTKEFDAGDTLGLLSKWQFIVRPSFAGKEYIGLYLSLANPTNSSPNDGQHEPQQPPQRFNAMFEVELQDPKSPDPIKFQGIEKAFEQGKIWGVQKLLQTSLLDNWEGGKLKLKINFTLFGEKPVETSQPEQDGSELAEGEPLLKKRKEFTQAVFDKCTKDIFDAMLVEHYADMVIKATDGEIKAHRFVLLARSKYFENAVTNSARFQYGHELPKLEVKYPMHIMKVILCHIYYGTLAEELVDPDKTPVKLAKDLAAAAEEYEMEGLRNFLVEFHPGLKKPVTSSEPSTSMVTDANPNVLVTETA